MTAGKGVFDMRGKPRVGKREMIYRQDTEKAADWAAILAKVITGDNVEEYLAKNNLYKMKKPVLTVRT
jgi:hypothetical protein